MNTTKPKRWQDLESIEDLRPGDLVRGKGPVMSEVGPTYMVQANYGSRATALRLADITNPPEWEVFK